MDAEDIQVIKDEPEILNTLPLIFYQDSNSATFKYDFKKDIDTQEMKMFLELEYMSHTSKDMYNFKDKIIGSLTVKTAFNIKTQFVSRYYYYQVFQEFTRREIEDLKGRFKELKLINYPLENITIPSYEEMVPILDELFYPEQNNN